MPSICLYTKHNMNMAFKLWMGKMFLSFYSGNNREDVFSC